MEIKSTNADDYWRVSERCNESKQELIDLLQEAGYKLKKSATKTELFHLRQRIRLGRLCYDKCAPAELKHFAVTRGLVDAKKNPMQRWLADKLMEADDERTFLKMDDLPPELRNLIYRFYISDFEGHLLEEPTQPPLARTCRMMRKEVLPLFYNVCTFLVKFNTMPPRATGEVRFRLDRDSYIFLTSLASGSLRDLRKTDIIFEDHVYAVDGCTWFADVDLSTQSVDVYTTEDGKSITMQRKVQKEANRVVRRMSKRKPVARFKMQDFYDLGSAVERGFTQK